MDAPEDAFGERLFTMINTAEVMSILFTRISMSLIADFRSTSRVPAEIMVDEVVDSARKRLLSFRRLRPDLPLPDQLTLAFWTPAIREFRDGGALASLEQRCLMAGGPALAASATRAFQDLLRIERQYLRSMALGEGMGTIWERER
jgi:hypothetical protein